MIDTIFYFCPTQEEYDRTADTSNGGQGISDKTITFVEDVREIYLNGKGYGKTSTAGLVSDDRLTSTIAALQESLNNTILQTNTNLDAVEADLLQQLTTAETGIQNTIATLRSDTEGAISRLKTEVLDDVDEGFVAKANLDTYVTNAVKDGLGVSSLADVALKSDITSSEATISTRFQTVEGDVSTLQGGLTTTNSSLATLQAQSDADHAKIAAVADWSGWVEGQPVSFNGGLITQANADGVIAGLIANSSTDVAAAVSAQVTRGTSNITLSADKIYLDANTTLANTILATQGNIAGFTISNNSLSASLGDYSIELTPYHFATFKNSTLTNEIKPDGSGYLASGALSWDENGNLQIGGGENGFSGSLVLGGTELIAKYAGSIISVSKAGSFRVYSQESSLYTPQWFTIQGSHPGSVEKLSINSTANHAEVFIGDEANHPGKTINLLVDGDVVINKTTNNLVYPGGNLYVDDNVTASSFIKRGGSSTDVLMADGSVKPLSEFSSGSVSGTVDWSNVQNKPTNVSAFTNDVGYLTSHQSLAGYLPLSGGTMNGDLNMAYSSKLNFGTSYIYQYTIPGPNGTNIGHILNFYGVDGNGYYNFDNSVHATDIQVLPSTGSGNSITLDGTSIKVNQAVENLSDSYVEIEPNNIQFGHSNGDVCNVNLKSDGLNLDSLVVALGFATKDGTGNEILMADGSTMTLAELKAALAAI